MADYPLTSTWAEIDTAAQAYRNSPPLTKAAQAVKSNEMTEEAGVNSAGKIYYAPTTAGQSKITDRGNYFDGTTVEAALQEVGAGISELESSLSSANSAFAAIISGMGGS